ncbi:hypothetical protein MKX01_012132 [Papaver californicum]|nr:hypothetical protein MKX01_012132 [Papaver californicum]
MKGLRQEDLVDGVLPKPEPPSICARCESSNTKFCYYNNYSVSQPRYFCRDCKRYWTRGGILRNVRVGGKPVQKQAKPPRRARTLDSSHPANALYYQLFQNRQLHDHHLALIQEQQRQQQVLQQQQRRSTLQPILNYVPSYRDAITVVSTNIQNPHPISFIPSSYSPAPSKYPSRDQVLTSVATMHLNNNSDINNVTDADYNYFVGNLGPPQNFHIPSFTPHQEPSEQYLVDKSQQNSVVGVNQPRLSTAAVSNGKWHQNSRIQRKDNVSAEVNGNVSAEFNKKADIGNNDKDKNINSGSTAVKLLH